MIISQKTLKKVCFFFMCFYLFFLLIIYILIILLGDRWWFATALMYGPKWIYLIPVTIVSPAIIKINYRLLFMIILSYTVIIWPIMGLNLPSDIFKKNNKLARAFRAMTYNVNRWNVTVEEFESLLRTVEPDFVAVQELAPSKWELSSKWFSKRYSTNVILSKFPIKEVTTHKRGREVNGVYSVIETPKGSIGFVCVDLVTPRKALKNVLHKNGIFDSKKRDKAQKYINERWMESEKLSNWINTFPEKFKIIAGDFNLTSDSNIYRTYWIKYYNIFKETTLGYGYTKKTKINIFRYNSRIDHILATQNIEPFRCFVGPDFGSDHLPLIADFRLNSSDLNYILQ